MQKKLKPYVLLMVIATPFALGLDHAGAAGMNRTELVFTAGDQQVSVNGEPVQLEIAPKLIGGTTYVPLRFLSRQLGADIQWLPEDKSVIYQAEQAAIQFWMNSNQAAVNGQQVVLDAPLMEDHGVSLVPLRFVGENLGAEVRYNPATKAVTIIGGQLDTVSVFADGRYTATGVYGNLPSSITVTVTLDNDLIIAVQVTPHATNEISLDLQRRFAEAVPEVVVGRPIGEVNVGRLAGSSGTPKGFNDAIEQIREQAGKKNND